MQPDKKLELISEKKAKEMYKEELDQLKIQWIERYYGGDVLEEIDPIAFGIGFSDFCNERLTEQGYKVEE